MEAGATMMLKVIVQPPVQFSHLIARLAVFRQVQQPIRSMSLNGINEEWRIEPRAGSILDVAMRAVVNEVAPSLSRAKIHQRPDILPIEFNFQKRLRFTSLYRQEID